MLGAIYQDLSRRERQIMDIVYRLDEASASEVRKRLPDPPSYSAVRAMLRILEDRGYLTHRTEGQRYVYRAAIPREDAQTSALERVMSTFFGNSISDAVAALLDMREDIPEEEIERLSSLIERAKKEGR